MNYTNRRKTLSGKRKKKEREREREGERERDLALDFEVYVAGLIVGLLVLLLRAVRHT
jgi:hypothetical protein